VDQPLASASDIPSLDRLLRQPAVASLVARHGRTQVIGVLRLHLDSLRHSAVSGTLSCAAMSENAIALTLAASLEDRVRRHLRPVFNLTGVVLHTNLGRAVLPDEAREAVAEALKWPVNLELELATGRRGDRDSLVESLLCELTGAEAATVVNNNAAAVLLMLSSLAARREVVVSRGELVEIGGSFRLPDIMRQAGVRLREVGTTNRTHPGDYLEAIGPRTALLLKVHTSNYAIRGFTASVGVSELKRIGRERGLPVAVDLGSGSLVDLSRWSLPREPTVRETLAAGADLVAFSGDKLLGGPQAGILVGQADLVRRMKANPLKRALRVGKLVLAALEPVLALYRAPELLAERLSTMRLLTRQATEMKSQAARLLPVLQQVLGNAYQMHDEPMLSEIGSGALPMQRLASHGLTVSVARGGRGSLDLLQAALRALPRPVIARLAQKRLWLDLRCLEPSEEQCFAAQWCLLRLPDGDAAS
jgi:L-seryl-tRNA(Ser) seleniumtransferase